MNERKKGLKKICITILLLFLVASFMYAAGATETGEDERKPVNLAWASAGPGSAVYYQTGIIAEFINTRANIPGLTVTAETTGGYLENTRLLERGETMVGFTSTSLLYEAMNSRGFFSKEPGYQNIRGFFPIMPSCIQWVTYNPSIKVMADLAGKRVNLGPPGSSANNYSILSLTAAGLIDNVQKETQGFAEAARLMQDGLVDAYSVTGAIPYPSIQESASVPGKKIQMIALEDSVINNILKTNPELSVKYIKANAYGNNIPPAPVKSVGYTGFAVAHKDTPEWVVYELLKALVSEQGRKFLVEALAGFQDGYDILPAFKELQEVGIKLHSGAVRYWQEQGVTVPADLIPPEYKK